MNKYKVGDKIVLTVTSTNEMGCLPCYVLNDDLILSKQDIDKYAEPLSNYTEAAAKVAEWEKTKEIKVGDVYMSRVGNYFVIYDIDHEKGIAKILWSDLSNSARELDDIKEYYIKTGRHIDIDSFLKQIGGEQE